MGEHVVYRTISVHNMFSRSAKRRASDKDLPVQSLFWMEHIQQSTWELNLDGAIVASHMLELFVVHIRIQGMYSHYFFPYVKNTANQSFFLQKRGVNQVPYFREQFPHARMYFDQRSQQIRLNSKPNSFRGNYLWKYGTSKINFLHSVFLNPRMNLLNTAMPRVSCPND